MSQQTSNTIEGFIEKDNCIYKLIPTKDGGEKEIKICHTLLKIKEILDNPETGEVLYKLEFDSKEVVLTGEDISQRKGMMKLAGYGVKVAEKHGGDLAEFLVKTIAKGSHPRNYIYKCFGWKKDGSFVLGKKKYSLTGIEDVTIFPSSKLTEAVQEKGTIKNWIRSVKPMLKYNPQRFKMYIGVSPMLLEPLKESNYSMNDFGETSVGKTVTTKVAMSMYGNPKDLILSDSTKVGMEYTATQLCDIPVNLDDTQNTEKKNLVDILYMIANGKGKLRGNLSGTQNVSQWRAVGMLTGEAPVIDDSTFKGLDARLLEIKGGLGAFDKEAVEVFESSISSDYGVFAPAIIGYILTNLDAMKIKHQEHIDYIYERKRELITDTAKNISSRVTDIFATILTSGYIFEEVYAHYGGERKDYKNIVLDFYINVVNEKISDTYTSKALDFIRGWITSKRSNFLEDGNRACDSNGNERQYTIFGNITSTYIDVISTELKTVLEKAGFNMRRVASDFKEIGLLESDQNGSQTQKVIKLEGKTVRVYRFVLPKYDELYN